MHKSLHPLILFSLIILLSLTVSAQAPGSAKQGPAGIFVFTGNKIPAGKTLNSYKIERSDEKGVWKQISEIKTPTNFASFSKAVETAKAFFPSQPIPANDKLLVLYNQAIAYGNLDSIKAFRLQLPVKMAFGAIYYDTTARKSTTYQYRISEIAADGNTIQTLVSDTLSLPYLPTFDTITYSESSYNHTAVKVRWKSVGTNPAPLFMIYKFRYGAPVTTKGTVSRFSVNDTTYYLYSDTALTTDAGKEMQFFVAPYDYYGNAGLMSQVAVITQDNFNKATFVKNKVTFMPLQSGVQVVWHFTDPVTVKEFEIYRGTSARSGFKLLATVAANDTSYLDTQIWPEKTYYYYVQAVAKAGKRTQQNPVLSARVPGIVFKEKLNAPILKQVAAAEGKIRLIIDVNDSLATQLRVYRGVKGGLKAMPNLVERGNSDIIVFYDSTLAASEIKEVFYAVRNEKAGSGISSLSEQLQVAVYTDTKAPGYFYALPSDHKMGLYWDDLASRDNASLYYSIARKNGSASSKAPLKVLAARVSSPAFADADVSQGNEYTYVLTVHDKAGSVVATQTLTVLMP